MRARLASPGHAVWLLPTPRFREAALASRGLLWEIASRTGNPQRALRNLLQRDQMFTERLRRDVEQVGLPAIEIDTTMAEEDVARRVAAGFGL